MGEFVDPGRALAHLAALLLVAAMLVTSMRRLRMLALGAGIACVAMVWQALPTVIGY